MKIPYVTDHSAMLLATKVILAGLLNARAWEQGGGDLESAARRHEEFRDMLIGVVEKATLTMEHPLADEQAAKSETIRLIGEIFYQSRPQA